MWLESKMEEETRFRTFSVIAVNGYRSHAVRRVELISFLYVLDIQYSFANFTVKTKAYNVIISRTVYVIDL